MLKEFLSMRNQINLRATIIGDWLRINKHIAYKNLTVPAVKVGIAGITADGIALTVGYNEDGPVVVSIPAAVFEFANVDQFVEWVHEVTQAEIARSDEAIRAADVAALKNLILRYPEETIELVNTEFSSNEEADEIDPNDGIDPNNTAVGIWSHGDSTEYV